MLDNSVKITVFNVAVFYEGVTKVSTDVHKHCIYGTCYSGLAFETIHLLNCSMKAFDEGLRWFLFLCSVLCFPFHHIWLWYG